MLFPARLWPDIERGVVTVAFRRWKRPSVKAGGTLQSPAGLLSIDEVAPIAIEEVTDRDARLAGHAGVAEAIAALRPEGTLYRVRFHRMGQDPRIALRQRHVIDPAEQHELRVRLARMPWSLGTLRLIAANPGVVSTRLAEIEGLERPVFKQRVRRLKALGLTESLEVGYRLSPRGEALLEALIEAPSSTGSA